MHQQHPLSAAFPSMSDDEFQNLKDSIEVNGVLNPITIYEGMVIDGWHRYRAANELGMDCPEVEFDESIDPKDFVLAQNKNRRHITAAQLAMATTAVYEWHPAHRPNKSAPSAELSKTSAELAEISGTSTRTIEQAKKVMKDAVSEVQDAVKSGKIGLPKAHAIAKLPKDQQADAIDKPVPAKQWVPKAGNCHICVTDDGVYWVVPDIKDPNRFHVSHLYSAPKRSHFDDDECTEFCDFTRWPDHALDVEFRLKRFGLKAPVNAEWDVGESDGFDAPFGAPENAGKIKIKDKYGNEKWIADAP